MKPFDYEKVSVEEAKRALAEEENPPTEPNWLNKRSPADVALLPATAQWFADLPETIRPIELAQRYPRIANDLCRLWKQVAQWDRYVADLLILRRGDRLRQGFPAQVASELTALIAYHETVYPPAPPR